MNNKIKTHREGDESQVSDNVDLSLPDLASSASQWNSPLGRRAFLKKTGAATVATAVAMHGFRVQVQAAGTGGPDVDFRNQDLYFDSANVDIYPQPGGGLNIIVKDPHIRLSWIGSVEAKSKGLGDAQFDLNITFQGQGCGWQTCTVPETAWTECHYNGDFEHTFSTPGTITKSVGFAAIKTNGTIVPLATSSMTVTYDPNYSP